MHTEPNCIIIKLLDRNIGEEEVQKVAEVIKDLPMRRREALALYYLCELSVVDTARSMNTTVQAIIRHLTAAHKKIALKLQSSADIPHSILAAFLTDELIPKAMRHDDEHANLSTGLQAMRISLKAYREMNNTETNRGVVS